MNQFIREITTVGDEVRANIVGGEHDSTCYKTEAFQHLFFVHETTYMYCTCNGFPKSHASENLLNARRNLCEAINV